MINSKTGESSIVAFWFWALGFHSFTMFIVEVNSQTAIVICLILTIKMVTFGSFDLHMYCLEVSFFGLWSPESFSAASVPTFDLDPLMYFLMILIILSSVSLV